MSFLLTLDFWIDFVKAYAVTVLVAAVTVVAFGALQAGVRWWRTRHSNLAVMLANAGVLRPQQSPGRAHDSSRG